MDMSNMEMRADDYIEVSEDPLLTQTMSYIHTQLAQMKSQLSLTLHPKPIPSIPPQTASLGVGVGVVGTGTGTSSQPTIHSTSLIDDDLDYNQEGLHTLPTSSTIIHPTAMTYSNLMLHPTSTGAMTSSSKSINKHSVTFSAEALFNSPEHKHSKTRVVGQSQSDLSDAIETLDDFSRSRDATNRSVDIMSGNNSYHSNASMGMDGSSSSSSDWLNRSQQPSFISMRSETFNNSSSINATDETFKAILDGGYYEGYWRAKYMRSNR